MDDLRPMPAMHVEDDWFTIYECMECGAVVRDPDTHVGWHASRHCRNGSAGAAETVVERQFADVAGSSLDRAGVPVSTENLRTVGYAYRHIDGNLEDLLCTAADEIERLRAEVASSGLETNTPLDSHPTFRAAADRIVHLMEQIERLRVVVGELSEALINTPCGCPGKCRCGRDAALAVWQEASRG